MSKTKVNNQSVTTVSNTKKKSRRVIAGFSKLDGFIRRSVAASLLFISLASFTGDPCKAIKKDGTRCKQQIGLVNGYCASHNPKANHCTFIKKDGERCKITVKATESRCRFHIGK